MMTRQEIFNKAYAGLRDQGFVRSVVGEYNCRYRGPNNTKCAFGHLIPDEQYNTMLEGFMSDYLLTGKVTESISYRITDVDNESNAALKKELEVYSKFKEWGDETFSPEDEYFIFKLQRLHDSCYMPEVMKSSLINFANNYGLTVPE